MSAVWRFDFLSSHSWKILYAFWDEGGVIKTTSDILLLFSLLFLPFLWVGGFLLVKKVDYASLFFFPFSFVSHLFGESESSQPKRFLIKNIKTSQQIAEDYKAEIESVKTSKTKGADSIRQSIIQKRTKK